jgi:S-formylglutathione hydrolase FrmB
VSPAEKPSRTQLWLESLGDWSWPGQGGAVAEALPMPPSWVPAFPPRLETAVAPAPARGWTSPRMLLIGVLLSALLGVSVALVLKGPLGLERVLGLPAATRAAPAAVSSTTATPAASLPLPALVPLGRDAAGSSIERGRYFSHALRRGGSFTVYLPSGYATATRRYPVLYLLHGTDQKATAFLQIGLQGTLDRLIAHHAIPPVIAVMIQGGRGPNNWRDLGAARYESYVLEVQELIDRTLPTIASRAGRAIAGDSMGGFGAMNLALGHPYRFAVVESWLGFYSMLEGELRANGPILARLGLQAFLYGARSDTIASPTGDPAFAARLRAAGIRAEGVIYPGGHNLETLGEHLETMVLFAGHRLARAG